MIRSTLILILFLFAAMLSYGQDTLTLKEYLSYIEQDHPMMVRYNLLSEEADANALMSRGGFDPKIMGSYDRKDYDDKNYYGLTNTKLKIPTWFGVEITGGYDHNQGEFLSRSDFIPDRGLWNAGISVPLGKGFIIDERRAALKRARLFTEANQQEQILLLNDLYYNAIIAYLDWQASYVRKRIAEEGVIFAQQRLEATRSSFVNGDKPAIDTLEALISLQTRQTDLLQANQDLYTTRVSLDNFLWKDGFIPLEITDGVSPQPIITDYLETTVSNLIVGQDEYLANHPELLLYDIKIADINIDTRLAREDLKPDVRVGYSPLMGLPDDGGLFTDYDPQEYKLSATLYYPILLRKERGKLKLLDIKTKSAEIDRALKRQQLDNKLDIYNNNMIQSRIQFDFYDEMVGNYARLLRAENRKFEIGESSIFLINSREIKYLESQYKRLTSQQKVLFNRLTYLYLLAKCTDIEALEN